MSPERLFSLSTTLALMGWVLLILAPRWKWTAPLLTAVAIPTLLGLVYLSLVAPRLPGLFSAFGSAAGISQTFQDPHVVVAGWVHYLAFDLFIGSWQVRDAQRLGIHHLLLVPGLLLTIALGPVGLLVYLTIRTALKRRLLVGWEKPHA